MLLLDDPPRQETEKNGWIKDDDEKYCLMWDDDDLEDKYIISFIQQIPIKPCSMVLILLSQCILRKRKVEPFAWQ